MILEYIHINRGSDYFFDAAKPLVGKIKFRGDDHSEIVLYLNEETAKKVLAIVADGIVEATKAVARDLTAEVINDQQRLLASGT